MNGLLYILDNFSIGMMIKNNDRRKTLAYTAMMGVCARKKIPIMVPDARNDTVRFGRVRVMFFPADPALFRRNNRSLVFKLTREHFSMLFPGDIMVKREAQLCRSYPDDLAARVLLSPHHGSQTASSKIFLDKINPESVIISCGPGNRYKFPALRVIDRYQKRGYHIFRTDRDGAVQIFSDGRTVKILTYKGG
jgi:competence protein ComEC